MWYWNFNRELSARLKPCPYEKISPDGQRFLMLKAAEQQEVALTQIHVVLNWFEELKRRVPVR